MAISPPSDLVLDVASAADPAKVKAATERLEKARAERAGEAFQAALATVSETGNADPTQATAVAAAPTPRNAPLIRQDTNPAKAMEKFEAFFLQTAVQEMLPKDATSVFGTGIAGDIWKSMLAEQVAAEMAKSAKFGIAERLAGKHFATSPGRGAATNSAVSPAHGDAAGTAKNLPFLQNHQSPATPAPSMLNTGAVKVKRS